MSGESLSWKYNIFVLCFFYRALEENLTLKVDGHEN